MHHVEDFLLLGGPFGSDDGGVEVVVIALAALLASPPGHSELALHQAGDGGPLAFLSFFPEVLEDAVFFLGPNFPLGHVNN